MNLTADRQISIEEVRVLPKGAVFGLFYKSPTDARMRLSQVHILRSEPGSEARQGETAYRITEANTFLELTTEDMVYLLNNILEPLAILASRGAVLE